MDVGVGTPGDGSSLPVDRFLTQLSGCFDQLLKLVEDGGLDGFDDPGLVGFMQGFETFRNRLPLIDHRVIRDATSRDLPGTLTQSTMNQLLVSALRLSPGEAARRVRAAEHVGDRVSMLGQPLAPRWPVLAAAQRDGAVSTEQVNLIERALAKVDRRGFDPADLDAGEQLLTEHAKAFGPKDLAIVAARVVDDIDPDGTLPKDQLNHDRRFLNLHATRDGAYAGEFRLTGQAGAKLIALLGPLAKPRLNLVKGPDGRLVEEPDPRHYGQRMHDALEDVCDRMLRTDTRCPTPAAPRPR